MLNQHQLQLRYSTDTRAAIDTHCSHVCSCDAHQFVTVFNTWSKEFPKASPQPGDQSFEQTDQSGKTHGELIEIAEKSLSAGSTASTAAAPAIPSSRRVSSDDLAVLRQEQKEFFHRISTQLATQHGEVMGVLRMMMFGGQPPSIAIPTAPRPWQTTVSPSSAASSSASM